MSFGDVDVVCLYAWQVEVAKNRVEYQAAARCPGTNEGAGGRVRIDEASDEIRWASGAGRGEDLATPRDLTVREKHSVVGDACCCAVANSQPLAVVYWGHGGKVVFPPGVAFVGGGCDPHVGHGPSSCQVGRARVLGNVVPWSA